MTAASNALVGMVGTYSQLGSLTFIVLLSWAVARSRRQVSYFRFWATSWAVLFVALLAIALRYSGLDSPEGTTFAEVAEQELLARSLYFVYINAKLLFLWLLLAGAWSLTRPSASQPRAISVLSVGMLVGSSILAASPNLNRIMAYQAAFAVPVFAACSWLLFDGPPSGKSLGTRTLFAAFLGHTVLWIGYGIGFAFRNLADGDNPMRLLLSYNSYIDAAMQTLLAYGMVMVVMEQTTRENRAAHEELERAHDALRYAAFHDPLSGCFNRAAFTARHGLEQLGAGRSCVAILDVDHLKPINDSFGHDAGDALLKHVAATLSRSCRASDALYRWGGDEFLIVMPDSSAHDSHSRLSAALRSAAALSFGGVVLPVRVSLGCADFSGLESIHDAISAADRAMYESKAERYDARGKVAAR